MQPRRLCKNHTHTKKKPPKQQLTNIILGIFQQTQQVPVDLKREKAWDVARPLQPDTSCFINSFIELKKHRFIHTIITTTIFSQDTALTLLTHRWWWGEGGRERRRGRETVWWRKRKSESLPCELPAKLQGRSETENNQIFHWLPSVEQWTDMSLWAIWNQCYKFLARTAWMKTGKGSVWATHYTASSNNTHMDKHTHMCTQTHTHVCTQRHTRVHTKKDTHIETRQTQTEMLTKRLVNQSVDHPTWMSLCWLRGRPERKSWRNWLQGTRDINR